MKPLSESQRRIFHAICNDVTRQLPLIPYRRAFACEAWKRYFLQAWVRESRIEARQAGRPDPFPVRPVPSSSLSAEQMSELLSFVDAYCAQNGIDIK